MPSKAETDRVLLRIGAEQVRLKETRPYAVETLRISSEYIQSLALALVNSEVELSKHRLILSDVTNAKDSVIRQLGTLLEDVQYAKEYLENI